jgi:hypothetical protein
MYAHLFSSLDPITEGLYEVLTHATEKNTDLFYGALLKTSRQLMQR